MTHAREDAGRPARLRLHARCPDSFGSTGSSSTVVLAYIVLRHVMRWEEVSDGPVHAPLNSPQDGFVAVPKRHHSESPHNTIHPSYRDRLPDRDHPFFHLSPLLEKGHMTKLTRYE